MIKAMMDELMNKYGDMQRRLVFYARQGIINHLNP